MNELQVTPTSPPVNKRGRIPLQAWAALRRFFEARVIRDGQWYAVPLNGLSIGYARRQANKCGFTTAVDDGVLKIRYTAPDNKEQE